MQLNMATNSDVWQPSTSFLDFSLLKVKNLLRYLKINTPLSAFRQQPFLAKVSLPTIVN